MRPKDQRGRRRKFGRVFLRFIRNCHIIYSAAAFQKGQEVVLSKIIQLSEKNWKISSCAFIDNNKYTIILKIIVQTNLS